VSGGRVSALWTAGRGGAFTTLGVAEALMEAEIQVT
jgi:hypothetical protein